MKKMEEFEQAMARIRRECVGESRMSRICPERLAPEVGAFLDDTEKMAFECHAEENYWLMERYCWLVCFVVDIFTERKDPDVPDDKYDLFKKYMAELFKLRDEVMESYKGTGMTLDDMRGKVLCFWEIIRSSSKWEIYRTHTLFTDPVRTYEVFKRLNGDWETLQERVGDVIEFCADFCKFKENMFMLDLKYNEEQLYQIFLEMLDGKKKFSEPIKVYKVEDTFSAVIDADAEETVNFGILTPRDWAYQETKHIEVTVTKTIKGPYQD